MINMNDWEINTDMNDDITDEPTQWMYKNKVMIDLITNGKYLVNVYDEDIGDFIYFETEWNTLEEAKRFVENAWNLEG